MSYCNWDYLEIFDGVDTTAPSLGQFCNALTGSPGVVTSTSGAVTILLHSDQAVNGTGFEADWSCVFPSAPPNSMFEISDSISCNATISFTDISTNGPSSWLWDFGDGNSSSSQHPIHTYFTSGVYDVKLITTNQYGTDTIIINNAITIIDMNLQTNNAISCGSASLVLNASTTAGIINWYDDISLQNLAGTGTSFTTPILSSTTSYYAQSVYEFASLFGGPNDNNFGSGSYYQGNKYLIFDNYAPSTLTSVLVYADSDAFRTIELRNSSNAILLDTTVFIPTSANGIKIYLNFDLPVQNNMQLGMSGTNNDMYRNSSGAIFPYNINDIVSITGTNAPVEYYYFFYDWEVKKEACTSNSSTVIATIDNNTLNTSNITACGTYLWPVDGQNYSTSGNYTNISTSASGCTHTETLNLTIDNNSTNTSNITACDSYTWSVDGQSYISDGTYTNVSTSLSGCIQTEILNLTISYGENIIDEVSFCLGDSAAINGITYYNPGFYTNLYQTVDGCDSTVQTILSVFPTINNTKNVLLCDGDSIEIGANTYTSEGYFIDTLEGTNSCDSILYSTIEISNIDVEIIWLNNQLNINMLSGISTNYSWNTGETTSSIAPNSSGLYWCIVSNIDNCNSDTAFYNYNSTSLHNELINSLSIFPNPTTGEVNITFFNNAITSLSIENILSENIYNTIISENGYISKQINISSFASGIYFLKIFADNRILTKKIILE